MAAVSLHPLASRSGIQSATVVSVEIPSCEAIDAQLTPTLSAEEADDSRLQHLYGSSPTTRAISPSPFQDDRCCPTPPSHHQVDDQDQDEHQCCWQDEIDADDIYGLQYEDLEIFPPLVAQQEEGQGPPPPIRAMTAEQFAQIQEQYANLDVPHSVLFPFLHGVDGDNVAQNAFFRAPLTGMPTPLYRGLTVIRADMPTQEQRFAMNRKRASSSASRLSHIASSHRSRTDSLATTASTFSNDSNSSSSEEENSVGELVSYPNVVTTSNSATSVSSSTTCSDHSRNSSLFSRAMSSDTSASSTCLDSDTLKAAEAAAYHAQASRHRNLHLRRSPVHEAQPQHSLLNSTVLPYEVITPPLMANLETNSLEVARQSTLPTANQCWINGATFLKPKQADGISLRNFKTQCAKYATISDIVVYCPTGLHDGVYTLAQWVRQAQEACFQERVARGLGGLRYNVFVIIDSFDVFEREQPHLIAVDGSGFSRNRIDFVERERDEMQRFTEATEIDDNVWMGNTGNVPYSTDEYDHQGSTVSLDSYLPQEVNPNAFSICIEAVEQADMPNLSQLSHASHYLDAFEATAMFEANSKEALRELEEEDESELDDERPSLGPNGWSPAGNGKRNSYRRSMPAFRQQFLYPPPHNIIHFKTLASGSCYMDDVAEDDAIENIVNMCTWIKKQACPASKSTSSHGSLLHGALRYGRSNSSSNNNNNNNNNSTWPKHQQQLPRRVLLHCSDGYTDTSILGLAYLMYSRQLTLPEAYLDLQNRCNRCFFVYGKDVPFLQRLAQRLAVESKALYGAPERSRSFNWSMNSSNDDVSSSRFTNRRSSSGRRYSNEEGHSEQSVWARGLAAATGLVSQSPSGKRSNGNLRGSSSVNGQEMTRTNTPTPRKSTPTPPSPTHDMSSGIKNAQDHRWFNNPNFQGSFPSKILPFLFLGNLSHAMNPGMLHAIGITHVVSVGESALVPPDVEESVFGAAAALQCGSNIKHHRKKKASFGNSCESRSDSLWEEERHGRISVLNLQNVSDDGIDSLRPHMNRAIEYIEQARLQGGKVLVHCRVGVSRSATICIAYVMAHCDLSMIESFLLVRSRRMNVLTQPTLLFVWEMRGFEAELARLKESKARRIEEAANGDSIMRDVHDEGFSLAALSISSSDSLDQNGPSTQSQTAQASSNQLNVDIGAGAGIVYGFQVKDYQTKPFNSGSLTGLNYLSAKLTHGYFCKLLSELNARYMVV